MSISRTRRAALVAAGTALALSLSGCAASLPQPDPEPAPAVALPVLSESQSDEVLARIEKVLATGDATFDATGLPERLTGPALTTRTAEYVRATATGGERLPVALPMVAQTHIVPDTTTWPRTQLVVTTQPDNLQAPRILVLTQASAREPYRLWGWARLGGGVEMPATAATKLGSAPVEPDATGLVVSPRDLLAQYADVLRSGDGSAYAATFPQDFFRTRIETDRATYQERVSTVATVEETYTPEPDQVFALATANGGAIVAGQLTTRTKVTISAPGASVTLNDPFEAALAGGRTTIATSSERVWTEVVVFYVPPAGSETTQVQLLAAEHFLTAVTGE